MEESDERPLAGRLRLAVVRLNRRLRAQRTSTLSLTQVAALSTLHRGGPMTPGELAARERVQPPSMTRVIAVLESHGFVSREPHPTDGRQTIVRTTEAAAEYIQAQVSAKERWLDIQLAELDESETEILSRAADIIERLAGR